MTWQLNTRPLRNLYDTDTESGTEMNHYNYIFESTIYHISYNLNKTSERSAICIRASGSGSDTWYSSEKSREIIFMGKGKK